MKALGIISFEDSSVNIEGLGDFRPVPATAAVGASAADRRRTRPFTHSRKGLGHWRRIAAQPTDQPAVLKGPGLVEGVDEGIGDVGFRSNSHAVDGEKGVGSGEGRAFVGVDEWMVLRQALPQRRRLCDKIAIMTALRAIQGDPL